MRLALASGQLPWRDLAAAMSRREVIEWIAWEKIYGPVGPPRDNLLVARICLTLVGLLGGKDADPKLADYLLWAADQYQPRKQSLRDALRAKAQAQKERRRKK